jgi:phosphoribosylformimino-5-aminoimidazole carboxamide ribotide isomerase
VYVIPAVDVLDGRVVRLRRGSYEDVTVYADDPVEILESWVDQGAGIVHVVDLAGARDGAGDRALWKRLGATGLPFQLGGGVRSVADAEQLIAAGASRAVLGTAAVWESGVVANIVGSVGADVVVAAVDVRDGLATGAGWRDEGRDVAAVMRDLVAAGVVRALVTGIAGDGMLTGPDTALIATVRSVAPDMALIASGGVGVLDDIAKVKTAGVEAVIVGRALYDGRFTFAEAAAVAAG